MRQGFPLLGIVPEDEDLIACGNSGTSIIAAKSTVLRVLIRISRAVWTESACR